jgi:mono/diheme cytochrome c family protein
MPPVRRLVPLAILLPLLAFSAGCSASKPGGSVTTPTPTKVVGAVPKTETVKVAAVYRHGDPAAGKVVFTSVGGCGSCHTLADAGTHGTVGPVLDQAKPSLSLAILRLTKGQGGMPNFSGQLTKKQIADVAAYVVKASGGNPNG